MAKVSVKAREGAKSEFSNSKTELKTDELYSRVLSIRANTFSIILLGSSLL